MLSFVFMVIDIEYKLISIVLGWSTHHDIIHIVIHAHILRQVHTSGIHYIIDIVASPS